MVLVRWLFILFCVTSLVVWEPPGALASLQPLDDYEEHRLNNYKYRGVSKRHATDVESLTHGLDIATSQPGSTDNRLNNETTVTENQQFASNATQLDHNILGELQRLHSPNSCRPTPLYFLYFLS